MIAVLLRLRGAALHPVAAGTRGGTRAALEHIRARIALRYAYLSCAVLTAFGLASLALAPALADGDPARTGWLLGAAGAGSLVYALLLSPFVNGVARMGRALSLALAWMGGWMLVAAWGEPFGLRVAAMFMFGLATSLAMVGSTGMVQVLAPPAMRGRMMGLFGVVGFGSQPLAAFVAGLLADRIGARHALALSGMAAIACALRMLCRREWTTARMPDAAAPSAPAAPGQRASG